MKSKISPFWKTFSAYDTISLMSQLYDGYDENTHSVPIVVLDSQKTKEYVEKNIHICGVKDSKTIEDLVVGQSLEYSDDKELFFKKENSHLDHYIVKINWDKLHEEAGKCHDLEAQEPYGVIQQEKIMRKIVLEKSARLHTNTFIVTESDLGSYVSEPTNEDNYSYAKGLDYHIQFIATLLQMEQNEFITILGFDFNFDAERTLVKEVFSKYSALYPVADHIYLPAKHCQVLIEITENNKTDTGNLTHPNTNTPSQTNSSHANLFKISFKNTVYNHKTALLTLNDIEIQIPPNTNQDYLCRVIFSNQTAMKKKWDWIEIIENKAWGDTEQKDNKDFWRKTYNAAHEVNTRIATEIGIKNFLLTKPTTTVQINPLYLP